MSRPPKKRSKLADYVIQRRNELGLNQLKLAEITGVSSGTIASIESGYSALPNAKTLEKLAAGLHVSYAQLDAIARGEGYEQEPNSDCTLQDFEHYLLNATNVPKDVAESLIEMIRVVVRRYD